jgi:hypothetical protein
MAARVGSSLLINISGLLGGATGGKIQYDVHEEEFEGVQIEALKMIAIFMIFAMWLPTAVEGSNSK